MNNRRRVHSLAPGKPKLPVRRVWSVNVQVRGTAVPSIIQDRILKALEDAGIEVLAMSAEEGA